jgi:lysophospholipase L1-like esterase
MKLIELAVVKIMLVFIFVSSLYPQSDSSTITLHSPNGGEYWTTGSFPIISWESNNVILVKIDFSQDNGQSWINIEPYAIAANKIYNKWQIPDISSNECLIKISKYDDENIFDISDNVFEITSDSVITNIVVIGSSTAAGIGSSVSDSAWVNRYHKYINQQNTNAKVVNLAVGGYTTYDLMPSDFIPPQGRPTPKVSSNITKALSYNPLAVIINLPSNDVTYGYSISEQLSNYDTILARSNEMNVPVWISTTQPRNLSDQQRLFQIEMRDSTFSRFGGFALDFWTDLANEDGRINDLYDSGDGIHLNDAGHKILFERVVSAEVYEQTILPTSVAEQFVELPQNFSLEQNYPNPFNPVTHIKFNLPRDANVILRVYDVLGQEVSKLVNGNLSAGIHIYDWDASNFSSGTYFYILKADDYFQLKKMLLLK